VTTESSTSWKALEKSPILTLSEAVTKHALSTDERGRSIKKYHKRSGELGMDDVERLEVLETMRDIKALGK
jgi:hypothetical protein